MASLLLAVIYLAFISLGLPDSLLGAGWPAMHGFFSAPLSAAGIVSMVIAGCTILSSLASDRLTRRLGTKTVVVISVLLTAFALWGFSTAVRYWMLCVWAVPYGLGAGSIDAALNNYVALHYTSRDMSWLHCFWGVGTIISPNIMSRALVRASWQAGYRTVALIQLGIALVLVLTLPLWRIHGPIGPGEKRNEPLGIAGALRLPGAKELLTAFFCYCSAESVCILWTASFLATTRGVGVERAAAFASLFFIGMTAGRFLSGLIANRLGDRSMIRLGAGIALFGAAIVAVTALPAAFTLAGCVIIGLGCAPIYPSIIHSTPGHFGTENSQAVIGLEMASAYVGSTFMPPLFGVLSNSLTMKIFPFFVGIFLMLMLLLVRLLYKKTEKRVDMGSDM